MKTTYFFRQSLLLFFIPYFLSCTSNKELEFVLDFADSNRMELIKVLEHYKDDPLKLQAASFLIGHMTHGYSSVPIMDVYRQEIMTRELTTKYMHDTIWVEVAATASLSNRAAEFVYDAKTITADYLINNIEEAFDAWESAPWFEQVDFSLFCSYILPYRIRREPLSDWRKTLREKYAPCIAGIETPEEAFIVVYNQVLTEFKKTIPLCPYDRDVLLTGKIMKGLCSDRSLYLTSILRALAIPAAYDYVQFWANFTSSGHSWVSYIRNDSTFTLTHNEKELKLYGTIDASRFFQKRHNYNITDLSYCVDSVKKAGRVFRATYETQKKYLKDLHQKDVSDQYGLLAFREMETDCREEIYLCCFMGGQGWRPVYATKAVKGKVLFEHMDKEVVYLPCYFVENEIIPIGSPFYMTENNMVQEIAPDETQKMNVRLNRKHVLTFHWTDRWALFLGGRFEGSNDPAFRKKDILHEVTKLPAGIVYLDFPTSQKSRYIRFMAREDADPNFAEIVFYGKKNLSDKEKIELKGNPISQGIDSVSLVRGVDKDNSTFFQMTDMPGVPEKGYWFGYDLGSDEYYITGVEFCPMSDQNMIEPGDLYELFYFNEKWIPLGEQLAADNHLIYENVPANALFWLRNRTKGKEERIFTYENDRQVWW